MSSRLGSSSRRVQGLWPSHLFSSFERARAPCRALDVPSPKNLPSPLQSISGWELKSFINQEVPDFERPIRKNICKTSSVAPRVALLVRVDPARSRRDLRQLQAAEIPLILHRGSPAFE